MLIWIYLPLMVCLCCTSKRAFLENVMLEIKTLKIDVACC